MDTAVSMCAVSNGQSTSGLKMKPKCIATVQTMEQGNPHALPSGRSIVRKIQCAGGKDARRSECFSAMLKIGIQDLSHPKGS